MGCLLGVGTIILLWSMDGQREKERYTALFFLLVFSMVLFNAYGFFTLPDTPLLFFTAFFLLLYKKFIQVRIRLVPLFFWVCAWPPFCTVNTMRFWSSSLYCSPIPDWFSTNMHGFPSVLPYWLMFPIFCGYLKMIFFAVKYHLFERPEPTL